MRSTSTMQSDREMNLQAHEIGKYARFYRLRFFLAILITLLLLFIIIFFIIYPMKKVEFHDLFVVVVDAGSTKSRFYLYKFFKNLTDETARVQRTLTCKADPVTKFNLTDSNSDIILCAQKLFDSVPKSYPKQPSLYFAATAGLRLLKEDDNGDAVQRLEYLNLKYSRMGFVVKFIDAISGEKEAVSGWISVNLLLKAFKENRASYNGALDLGGASTQFAFVNQFRDPRSENVRLFKHDYSVNATSYLCFGTNMLKTLYVTYVLGTDEEKQFFCFLKGSKIEFDFTSNFCHHPNGKYILPPYDGKPINTSIDACKKQVLRAVSFLPIQQIITDKINYKAFSAYYYITNFMKDYGFNADSYASLYSATNQFCHLTYAEMVNKTGDYSKYAIDYCLLGVYITVLLDKYGFDERTFPQIEFVKTIDDEEVDWSVGYMVSLTQNIDPGSLKLYNEDENRKLIISFSIIISIVALILLFFLILILLPEKYFYKYNFLSKFVKKK